MRSLETIVNIGPKLAEELGKAGFTSIENIQRAGLIETIRRLRAVAPERDCTHSALAIAGAMKGIRWHSLPLEERKNIKNEIKMAFHQ